MREEALRRGEGLGAGGGLYKGKGARCERRPLDGEGG